MKKLNDINNLNDLLKTFEHSEEPVLVRLCSRCGNNRVLIDQVVKKVQKQIDSSLNYFQLSEEVSTTIKQELRILKNPVLLIIQHGIIRAVLGGMIAPHQLEKALSQIAVKARQ